MRRWTGTAGWLLVGGLALGVAGCGGKKRAPGGAPPADAAVAPLHLDAAVPARLPATAGLEGLPAVDVAQLQGCTAYATPLAEIVAEVTAAYTALAAASDPGAAGVLAVDSGAALGRFADAVRDARERLRPLAPLAAGDVGIAHNALMSALDRIETGAREGVTAAGAADRTALAAANDKLAAGVADLRFALGKLNEMCAAGATPPPR